jgi:hypothetical protein
LEWGFNFSLAAKFPPHPARSRFNSRVSRRKTPAPRQAINPRSVWFFDLFAVHHRAPPYLLFFEQNIAREFKFF